MPTKETLPELKPEVKKPARSAGAQVLEKIKENAEIFRQICAYTPIGIFEISGPEGRYLKVNQSMCALSGYSRDELLSMNAIDLLTPGGRKLFQERYRAAQYNTPPSPMVEYEYVKKNGEKRWALINIEYVYENNRLVNGRGIVIDITEKKLAEEALKASETKFRLLVEEMNDGFSIQDENNRFTYVNQKICEMTGYSHDELINKPIIETLNYNNRNIYQEQVDRRRQGQAGCYEMMVTTKDKSKINLRISSRPLYDEEGRYKGSFGIITDITERKRLEAELREFNAGLEDRVRERTAELARANEQLKAEITQREKAQNWLRQGGEIFKSLFESLECVYIHDLDGSILRVNQATENLLGYSEQELLSMKLTDLFEPRQTAKARQAVKEITRTGAQSKTTEFKMKKKNGDLIYVETKGSLITYGDDRKAVLGVARDITERKKVQQTLIEKTVSLQTNSKRLQELNTTLKVLLEFRETEKSEQARHTLNMINKLVMPFLNRLSKTRLNNNQRILLEVVSANMKTVASPLASRITSPEIGLTPTETQITELIRQGKSSKDIALLLGLAIETVSFHRKRVRAKMNLKDRKINLRTYLQSLAREDNAGAK